MTASTTTNASSLTQRRKHKDATTSSSKVDDNHVTNTPTSKSQQQSPSFPFSLLDGIGGTGTNFSFFQAPSWVDLSLPPGCTSQIQMNLQGTNVWSIVTGHSLVYSPNLIWFLITIAIYVLAPYDIEALAATQTEDASSSSWFRPQWFLQRALLNASVMLTYYGFWHIVLYYLGWASRPFTQARVYRLSKLFHNMWYCLLGVLQWTAWEMIMVHLYATNRIGYQRDDQIIWTNPKEWIPFVAGCIFVPVFREVQFFFAHRFLHIKCLYKYMHALHHRNTDIEPFSGLCMSPSEHLYYFSSIGPSLYWPRASPFLFLWNGMHLILSPGASHSGYEDHWHSDQYHAAHHLYFECNYGTPSMPLDRWFGCFRETMAPRTKAYQGDAIECMSPTTAATSSKKENEEAVVITARPDVKSTLLGLPTWDQMLYMMATGVGLPFFVGFAASQRDNNNDNKSGIVSFLVQAPVAALVVSLGPLILAALLALVTAGPSKISGDKFWYTMIYPFHKNAFVGRLGVTLLMGGLLGTMPIYHFFHSLFVTNPEDTFYNRIWNSS